MPVGSLQHPEAVLCEGQNMLRTPTPRRERSGQHFDKSRLRKNAKPPLQCVRIAIQDNRQLLDGGNPESAQASQDLDVGINNDHGRTTDRLLLCRTRARHTCSGWECAQISGTQGV